MRASTLMILALMTSLSLSACKSYPDLPACPAQTSTKKTSQLGVGRSSQRHTWSPTTFTAYPSFVGDERVAGESPEVSCPCGGEPIGVSRVTTEQPVPPTVTSSEERDAYYQALEDAGKPRYTPPSYSRWLIVCHEGDKSQFIWYYPEESDRNAQFEYSPWYIQGGKLCEAGKCDDYSQSRGIPENPPPLKLKR